MSGLGAGMGMLLDVANTELDYQRAKSMKKQDVKYQKEMADYYYDLAMKKFENTGYEAQAQQLKNAGLNVGLMYGSAGQGGQSTSTPSPTQEIPYTPRRQGIMDMAAIQNAEAQTKLANAQANKANAEAEKISGVDTTEAEKRIENITQGIENQKAQQLLTQAQERITSIQADVANASMEDQINKINYETHRAFHEVKTAQYEADLSEATYNDKINIIKYEAVNKILQTALTRAQTGLTQEQIKQTSQDVINSIRDRALKGQEVNIKAFEAELKAMRPNIQEKVMESIEKYGTAIDELMNFNDTKYRNPKDAK